ncbi:MAG: carboxypeptidase regulatory-like domain-containing protein [Bacteroidales bacterium]|jgi:hypothetical protein|nr:carboxypeptidase regulatory-like domain-containing protein [Bacteroidales bacterium]
MLKTFKSFLILAVTALLLSACNKGPGEGGTGTVQGFVKLVHHPDDDYTLTPDTMVAAKTDVFIIYGDEAYFGDDAETNANGMYRFEYLRPGNYTVFAYSTLPSGEKVAVSETVELQRGTIANVPTLYIHDGKAYGTSVVKGRVHAAYYHNGSYRGEGWACEHRVYIRRVGDDIPFDDTRVGPDGYFAFQKLQPGEYEVYTVTQDFNEVPDFVFQTIMVEEAGQVYEFLEQFEVIINV